MKNMIVNHSSKRVLAVIMTLVLLLGLLPVSALAAEDVPSVVVTTEEDVVDTADGKISLREAVAQAHADPEAGEVTFHKDLKHKTLTLSDPLSITGKVTIVLSSQTVKGQIALEGEDAELTVKGEGTLESEDFLFFGDGAAVIDLDGKVTADLISTIVTVGDGVALVPSLTLKRGEFHGAIAMEEGKTLADYLEGVDCEVKDGESWKALGEEDSPEEFRVRPAGEPARVEGLCWDGETAGWNAVAGAESYQITLYKAGAVQDTGAALTATTNSLALAETFVNAGLGDGAFAFTVVAVKGEKTSLPSAMSPEYKRDKTAPEIRAAAAERTALETASVTFRAGEAGTYYYAVVDAGAEAPTVDTAGEGTAYTQVDTDVTIAVTGLTAGEKDFYLVVKDAAGNVSAARKVAIRDFGVRNVTLTPGEGFTYKTADDAVTVKDGETFGFEVRTEAGYKKSESFAVRVEGVEEPLVADSEGKYTVTGAGSDIVVTVIGVEKETYTVTLPEGGAEYTATAVTTDPVYYGGSFVFTVTPGTGYETPVVKVGETTLTEADGKYTIENITGDVTVTVSVSKSKLAITTEGEGFTLEPVSAEVEYGGSYTFAVKAAEGWKIGEAGLTVTVDGIALTAVDGKYTVENITKATAIKVEGLEKITYTITLPTGDGFTVTADSGSNTVIHGEDFAFTVTVDSANGYVLSPDFAVKVGETALTGENGKYTIPAVTGDQTVTVTGVSLSSFNIQVSTGGYSIIAMAGSKNPAPYGSSYKFKLELKPGYMKTADFAVKANSTPLTADSSGVYTVENIRANTTIEIFGVSNGTYNVTFSSDASYTVSPVNSTLPVAYNGSYSFKVEPNPGYVRGNAFSVKQDGLAMSPDANGVYTIYNIQQNHNVTITGVVAASTAVNYSVTLSGGTGYSYSAQNGSTSPVAPGGSYSFKVNLANGYTKGTNFAVKVNGNTLTANTNGVYTISNINANQTVTVTGVIKSATGGGGTTVAAAPSVTTTTLPNGAMGTAYNQTLKANGQNITWSHTGTLPNGLSLNTTTGVISGTPTLNGTFRFAVKATNNAGSNTRQLTITVTGEEYKISDGQKAEWTQGGEEGVLFKTDSKAQYVKVQVDGKDVATRYVETADNGASITLKPEYLEDLDNGAHTLTIVYADGSAKTTFTVAAEDKTEPPTIAMQPESQTANSGDKISFTIMANGTTPLICQWQVDKNDGNGWQNITGAVNASYTVTADTVHNGYKFRCTVTNGAGSVTSDEAVLTVAGADVPAEDGAVDPEEPETLKKKSNTWLWITVAAVAVAGIAAAGIIVYRNRKYYNE